MRYDPVSKKAAAFDTFVSTEVIFCTAADWGSSPLPLLVGPCRSFQLAWFGLKKNTGERDPTPKILEAPCLHVIGPFRPLPGLHL